MGRLTPALEALAEELAQGVSRTRRPVSPTPISGAPPERAGDQVTASVDLAKILAMPLDEFAREGQLLQVRVPWLDVTVWFLPGERDAEELGREGMSRGRIWTAGEIGALMALPDPTPEIVQRLALAKREFGGDIVEVRRRSPARNGRRQPPGIGGREQPDAPRRGNHP